MRLSEARRPTPKPTYWSSEFATWFRDPNIVSVYHYRPPYPSEVFDLLSSLAIDSPRHVLDIGCGTGDICRLLAPSVDHIDAIDFSAPMIARGKKLVGGDAPNITWIEGAVEEAPLAPPYALITAGESIHWMDWDVVLPRFGGALTQQGMLAIVERNWDGSHDSPFWKRVAPIFREYSAKEINEPFDLIRGLEDRGFERRGGRIIFGPWHPTIAECIECRHAQNSFSRDQMGAERAEAFDTELRAALEVMCADGTIRVHNSRMELEVCATVTWGRVMVSHAAEPRGA